MEGWLVVCAIAFVAAQAFRSFMHWDIARGERTRMATEEREALLSRISALEAKVSNLKSREYERRRREQGRPSLFDLEDAIARDNINPCD